MRKDAYRLSQDEELIQAYRDDPPWAVKELFGISLNWFQRIILRSLFKVPFVLLLLGRGCGKTSLTTIYLVLKAMLYPGMKIGCIGPSLRQANFVFDEMRFELLPNSPFLEASLVRPISIGTIRSIAEFDNGSFIEALPIGDGSKIRGRRYNLVFVDEYADVPKTIVDTVVMPFLNVVRRGKKNQMIIASTARYKWNHLWTTYVLYKAKAGLWAERTMEVLNAHGFKIEPEKYMVHEYDFRDIWEQSDEEKNNSYNISEDVIEKSFVEMTNEEFGMENLNLFPDDTAGFFPAQLIMDAAVTIDEDWKMIRNAGESFILRINKTKEDTILEDTESFFAFGVDVARSDNPLAANFCLQVMKIRGLKRGLCKTITLHGASYQEMVACIRKAHIAFGLERVVRIDMDAGGGGTTIRDLLSEPWRDPDFGVLYDPILEADPEEERYKYIDSRYRILYLHNQTDTFNNYMFHQLKADLQSGRTVLPPHLRKDRDPEIQEMGLEILKTKTEMIMLEAKATKAGFKYEAPKGHQKDRVVSFGLANYGVNIFLGGDDGKPQSDLPVGFWIRRG